MQIYFDYILHSFKKRREVLGLQFFSVYYLSERSDVKKYKQTGHAKTRCFRW